MVIKITFFQRIILLLGLKNTTLVAGLGYNGGGED